ncbi:MAG: peptide deformylase [Chlorobi bacterium]|nr:peptide deformylase [Chlorobiota bacterium]
MILPVYLYNHPILRQRAEAIKETDDELTSFVSNMFETMYNANGIGLAANQVGSRRAVIVVDIGQLEENGTTQPLCLLNPQIIVSSDQLVEYEEGCLSVPGIREIVFRPDKVTVEYDDLALSHHRIEAEGMLARVLQHEIDHLNGIYFFDRISPMRRTLLKNRLKRIERGSVSCDYPCIAAGSTPIIPAR